MTHCRRVLDLLSDGKPHSHLELYALRVVAHSRISDLRKQGHQIEQWRDGDLYLYRLLEEAPATRLPGASSSGTGQAGGTATSAQPAAADRTGVAFASTAVPLDPQLTLDAA